MIQIEDKNGETIEVANLAQAIKQAHYFRNFSHTDKLFEKFDQKRQAYWQDMFINATLASIGVSLFWKLFREGRTAQRGFFLNLGSFKSEPMMVG